MSGRIKAGIIGGAGYTGGETLRLLLNHPQVDMAFVQSKSQAGLPVTQVHTDLLGDTDLRFTAEAGQADVLFLCLGHGDSRKYLEQHPVAEGTHVIDLSQDFRLGHNADGFVYGLPELKQTDISKARHIANPGCFATCIQLALLPLAAQGKLNGEIHISATTGSTGAGQSLSPTSHFSWRNNNLSVYKAFEHQHLAEIAQSLGTLQPGFEGPVSFIPYRGGFTRGIFTSAYLNWDGTLEEARELYRQYYEHHPFTHVSPAPVDVKQVVNTNKCLIYLEQHGSRLLVQAVIDNLLKGASGQAVQNMNLLFGLPETTGLKLKPSAF